MKKKIDISNSKKNKKKKLIGLTSLFGLSLLSITAVTSCTSASSVSSSTTTPTSSVNTNDATKGFGSSLNSTITNDLSLNSVATDSLKSSTGSAAWFNDKAYQLLYNWFSTNKSSVVQNQFSTIEKTAKSSYTSEVDDFKNEYGSNWEYYVQNNLLDPVGGTVNDYLMSQMYSSMLTQFEDDIFNSNSSTSSFKQFLGFDEITKDGTTLLPYSEWTTGASYSSDFIDNPQNWASNTESGTGSSASNWNLGFFPNNLISSSDDTLLLQYCNFDQYLFDQWIINENPFICSSILYEYTSSQKSDNSNTTSIYNTTYFSNLSSSSSNSLAFPEFNNPTNTLFKNKLLADLTSATAPTTTTGNTYDWYVNNALDSWYNQSVYSSYNSDGSYNTGGFNFLGVGQAGDQVGYFVTNDASLESSDSSSYQAFSSYLPSYAAAAINRFNVLLFDQDGSSSVSSASGVGGNLYNLINVSDLNSNILANFLFSNISSSSDDSSAQYQPGYYNGETIPAAFSVLNPEYTYLFYNSSSSTQTNGQILNSTTLPDFWNYDLTNNIFENDTSTILQFTPLYGSGSNEQISPYTFTRDGDGVHVISVDGYYRILAAEKNIASTGYSSAIASPIDVYPDPTNAYEAGIDAVAQDILWRQMQLDLGMNTGIKIDLFTSLQDYFKANFAKLLLGYAEELLSTSSSTYNPLFGQAYNLFADTNLQEIFNTQESKEEIATINLIYDIAWLQNYITEQSNENTFKKQVLVTYTDNSSSSSSSSSSSTGSYGIGTDFYENGLRPAFPYNINLRSSLLYPNLSFYIYHLTFTNTTGLFYSTNNTDAAKENNAAQIYSQFSSDQTILLTLDQQLSNINTTLSSDITSYLSAINLSAWDYSNGQYAKYSQYVFTNNYYVNAAIEAMSKSSSELGTLVENDILSNALNVSSTGVSINNTTSSTTLSLSSNNDYGLSNSVFSNDSVFNATDSNYGSDNYLTTALIYEYFLSNFSDSSALSVNYGYNYTIPANSETNINNSIYLPTSSNYSTWETDNITNVTNTIANYYLASNYLYSDGGYDLSNSSYNSYLTLLNTINYLYDDGSWANLWDYLDNTLANSDGIAYVVWVGGDSSSYLNNTSVSTGSSSTSNASLSNTGSSAQYVNALNSYSNSSNYNTLNSNYGTSGYSYGTSSINELGYSPFNYIPNANLDGNMLSEFMDENLAKNTGSFNLAFNNISTYNSSLANYFNMANVDIGVLQSNKITEVSVPFTGFLGLQTSSDDTALSDLGLATYLFSDANDTIDGDGLLASYSSLGNDPTTDNTASSQPSGSLMQAILSATSTGTLTSIGETLNGINSSIPQFSTANTQNNQTIQAIDQSYAETVYNAMTKKVQDYQRYFENFDGYVSNITYTASNSDFASLSDMYDLISGGTGLEYNNLYNTWSQYQSLLSSSMQGSSQNFSVINSLAQDRLISATPSSSSTSYDFMMYADQISQNTIGSTAWSKSTWANGNTVWSKLGLTQDAFVKLLVQIAQIDSEQTAATNAFVNEKNSSNVYINKVDIYDLRFRTALGSLWISNWFND